MSRISAFSKFSSKYDLKTLLPCMDLKVQEKVSISLNQPSRCRQFARASESEHLTAITTRRRATLHKHIAGTLEKDVPAFTVSVAGGR